MLKPLLLAISVLSACSSSHAAPAPAPAPVHAAPRAPVASASTDVYELAARRAQMLAWLREYREAGVFPADVTGLPVSIFVDMRGVRCPMAELLYRSGREDLVAAVAKDNNGVRLVDVRQGPLFDWMLASGLTMAEINLVQGAMNIDYGWMNKINIEHESTILAAKAQVRGKLETAELALRDNTATSLALVVKRLPVQRTVDELAHASLASGDVVPKVAAPPARPSITIDRAIFAR